MPYLGRGPGFGIRQKYFYTATAGQTSISGSDNNSLTLTFTDGLFIDVYLNGVLLDPNSDYNTTTANTVAGLSALSLNDFVEIVAYDSFSIGDVVPASSGGTFSGAITVQGDLSVSGTLNVTGDSSSGDDAAIGNTAAEGLILTGQGSTSDIAIKNDADSLVASVATGTTVMNFASTPTAGSVAVKVAGVETIWVPANSMYPNTTNGCALITQVELSNGPEIKVLDFDASSDENAQFSVAFPKSWNEGTITFKAYFTVTGTNTGTVAWGLSGVAIADDDSINTAFGTNVVATAKAHSGTSNDLDVTAESGAVTIAGSPAAGEQVFFQIMRDVSADNQSGDARLLGVQLFFTTDAANDA